MEFQVSARGCSVLFWVVGHPGACEVISCGRLSVLSASQAIVGSCFHTLFKHWICLDMQLRSEREWGRGRSGQGCTPFVFLLLFRLFVFFLIFYLLSFSLSLSLPPVFLPSSVYLSFPSLPSTSCPPLFLSMVAALMKCYFLASLQNCLKHFKTHFPTSLL